jgi:hypothetical protein
MGPEKWLDALCEAVRANFGVLSGQDHIQKKKKRSGVEPNRGSVGHYGTRGAVRSLPGSGLARRAVARD